MDKRCKNCAGDKRGKHGECFYCGGGSVQIRDICDPAYNAYADIARRQQQSVANQRAIYNQNEYMQQYQMQLQQPNNLKGYGHG